MLQDAVTPQAVLITGVFGSGKSSVAVEIADILEIRHLRFALLDLDYLTWGFPGSDDAGAEHAMMLKNLRPVVANYIAVGVDYFVLARFIRDDGELKSLRAELGMPLRVVRLTVPVVEIERRLSSEVTSGRQNDLRAAALSIARGEGSGIEDTCFANDGGVQEVATEILAWLSW